MFFLSHNATIVFATNISSNDQRRLQVVQTSYVSNIYDNKFLWSKNFTFYNNTLYYNYSYIFHIKITKSMDSLYCQVLVEEKRQHISQVRKLV